MNFRARGARKKTQGGVKVNQSNNHSKLTDSNNCVFFFLLADSFCFCFICPPPCVFFRALAPESLSSLGDREHVKHVRDRHASSLSRHEIFRPLEPGRRARSDAVLLQFAAFFARDSSHANSTSLNLYNSYCYGFFMKLNIERVGGGMGSKRDDYTAYKLVRRIVTRKMPPYSSVAQYVTGAFCAASTYGRASARRPCGCLPARAILAAATTVRPCRPA